MLEQEAELFVFRPILQCYFDIPRGFWYVSHNLFFIIFLVKKNVLCISYGGIESVTCVFFHSVLARGSRPPMSLFGTFDGSSGDGELKIVVNEELYLLQNLYGSARGESI